MKDGAPLGLNHISDTHIDVNIVDFARADRTCSLGTHDTALVRPRAGLT